MEYLKAIFAKLKGELVTQLNLLATAVLLWISQQPNAPLDDIIAFLPVSVHGLAKLSVPILWGIVVQLAIELLRKRTHADATAAAADPVA